MEKGDLSLAGWGRGPTARKLAVTAARPQESPPSSRTKVSATHRPANTTDLTISGKAAQFGRGVSADVSDDLIGQFAKSLEASVLGDPRRRLRELSAETSSAAAAQADAVVNRSNLLSLVAVPLAKRHIPPVAAGMVVGLAIGFLPGRRNRKSPAAAVADELLHGRPVATAVMKAAYSPITGPTPSRRRPICSTS